MFAASNDYGISFAFAPPRDLGKQVGGASWLPVEAVTAGNVYVTWYQVQSLGVRQVYFVWSHDNGVSFSTPIDLGSDAGPAVHPVIGAYGSLVCVLWDDNLQPIAKISQDGGSTFGNPVYLNGGSGRYIEQENDMPEVIVLNNVIYATWLDTSPGIPEVFYSYGTPT
jgi:hypothetical protein